MKLHNSAKAAGLGSAMLLLTAGVASAAVATASVNVRTGPGTGYRIVDTLRPGEQVAIVDRAGGWCAVQKTGPNGWVSCRYLGNSVRYRDDGPNISFNLGFGIQPDRPHRPRGGWWWGNHDRDHDHDHDHNSGGHWSGPSSFGMSFSN